MVMADYFVHDRLQELWNQINHLHLSYLHTEDSPQKIEQRNKLEACIRDYLYLSPHKNKFFCPETAEILHRSASTKKDFSGYKAAVGWNAISIYAGNLLSQPWRKEYRQIKTYSGFYKHQIEANLAGAEAIFEAMGYKYMGNGILVMDGPPCPDRLTHVSQDSIVAFVECQILKTIWEEVSNIFKINWLEVLEFRETHICSSDQSIRMLSYQYHEKKYQELQNRNNQTSTINQIHHPNSNHQSILINQGNSNNNQSSENTKYLYGINNHSIHQPHPPPISSMHSFPPHDTNHTHYREGLSSAYRETNTPNSQSGLYEMRHARTGSSDFGYQNKIDSLNHHRSSDVNLVRIHERGLPITDLNYGSLGQRGSVDYNLHQRVQPTSDYHQGFGMGGQTKDLLHHTQLGHTQMGVGELGHAPRGVSELGHAHRGVGELAHAPRDVSDLGHVHRGVGNCGEFNHGHSHFYGPITSHTMNPCQQNCVYGYPYNFSPLPVAYPRFGYCNNHQIPSNTRYCNGYNCYPQNFICPVPTGQLIELENHNNGGNYDTPDGVIKNLRHQKDYYDHKQLAKSTNLDSLTLSKSREDGTGTFESWDYVYRNLESQGYSKDLGERGDLLQEKRKSLRERKTKSSIELEDAFNSLNMSSGTSTNEPNVNVKVSEGIKIFNNNSNSNATNSKVPLSNSYDNITQETTTKKPNQNGISKNVPTNSKSTNSKPSNETFNRQNQPKLYEKISPEKPLDPKKLRKNDVDKLRLKDKDSTIDRNGKKELTISGSGTWNCKTCTYINKNSIDICVMCGKSQKILQENSMQVGGQQCPKCTLVNPKNINFCQACNSSLKGSPTYI